MNEVVSHNPKLSEEDQRFLDKVRADMPIVCDISRADFLLYRLVEPDTAVVTDHLRPHSIAPTRLTSVEGSVASAEEEPLVIRALRLGKKGTRNTWIRSVGTPIVQQVFPIRGPDETVIAALSIETNLLEHERLRRRRPAFRRALRQVQAMLLRGQLVTADTLSPFGEHDGILVADRDLRILYVSGIATNLYRRLGYAGNLVGRTLTFMKTGDAELVSTALSEMRCLEVERKEGYRHWLRKAIPLLREETLLRRLLGHRQRDGRAPVGVMVLLHDATVARRREQDIRVRSAIVQEVHHRVKNNLQAVASLLRMQARRADSEEARAALVDGANRILSVAVVHEFLSQHESRVINIREVSQRIINQVKQTMAPMDRTVYFNLKGRSVYLPNQQATACALVINELLNNALEHGFRERAEGTITIELQDTGDEVAIRVVDDGEGLPDDFSLGDDTSLGLTIVQTLVQGDLKGVLRIEPRSERGTIAVVTFPKTTLGGDERWNERE